MFNDLIRKRRSIRKFTKDSVEKEKIQLLVEAALLAPTSKNLHPWTFVVVTDRELLAKLSRTKPHGSTFLKNAPCAIVVCANDEKSDVWAEDCAIASTFILLAAESLNLGACWIQIRKRLHDDNIPAERYILDLLNLQQSFKVESIIAIGHPAETKPPHSKEELLFDKVIYK